MSRKFCFIASIAALVLVATVAVNLHISSVAAFQPVATPPILITKQTQFGMFSVNENTGAISFCANNTVVPGGGGQAPIGTCSASAIATVAPTVGSNNSLSIEGSGVATNGSGTAALIYNNQSGQAMLCAGAGVVSGGVANATASCKAVTSLH